MSKPFFRFNQLRFLKFDKRHLRSTIRMPMVILTLLWILYQWLFVIFLVPTGDIRTRWAPDNVYRVIGVVENTETVRILQPNDVIL